MGPYDVLVRIGRAFRDRDDAAADELKARDKADAAADEAERLIDLIRPALEGLPTTVFEVGSGLLCWDGEDVFPVQRGHATALKLPDAAAAVGPIEDDEAA